MIAARGNDGVISPRFERHYAVNDADQGRKDSVERFSFKQSTCLFLVRSGKVEVKYRSSNRIVWLRTLHYSHTQRLQLDLMFPRAVEENSLISPHTGCSKTCVSRSIESIDQT